MTRRMIVPLLLCSLLGIFGSTYAANADGDTPPNGLPFATGANGNGQLGTGDLASRTSPAAVNVSALPAGTSFATLSAGTAHVCALTTSGNAYCWGEGDDGRLGNGDTTDRTSPTPVSTSALPSGTAFIDISAGHRHTCAVTTGGLPYCWGNGTRGQLGTGTSVSESSPVPVSTSALPIPTFRTVVASGYVSVGDSSGHTCGITTDGLPYCWGEGDYGRLGTGNTDDQTSPTPVSIAALAAGTTIARISVAGYHTCALTTSGTPYCWGYNGFGQLGTGNSANSNVATPVSISALPDQTFTAIAGNRDHNCALTTTGTLYCWGYGDRGRLGTGNTTTYTSPTPVSVAALPVRTFAAVSTGWKHTCAITTAGVPYCWGVGDDGRLGTSSTIDQLSPTPVSISALPGQSLSLVAVGETFSAFLSGTPSPATLGTAPTPAFDTPVATVDGFTVNVTNYDPLFTWSITASQGSVTTASATGALWPLTITGLTPGASTTITVSTTRAGYQTGSATVTGTAQAAAVDSSPPIPQLLTPDTTPTSTTPPVTTVAPSTTSPSTTTAPPTTTQPLTPAPATNDTTDLLPPPSPDTITGLPTRTLIAINTVQPGATVTVTSDGFEPNEPVALIVASTPRIIATGNADTTGTATLTGTIPLDLAPGDHTLAIYAPDTGTGLRQAITLSAPRLPATGTDPTPLVALLLMSAGLALLNLRSWRHHQRSTRLP